MAAAPRCCNVDTSHAGQQPALACSELLGLWTCIFIAPTVREITWVGMRQFCYVKWIISFSWRKCSLSWKGNVFKTVVWFRRGWFPIALFIHRMPRCFRLEQPGMEGPGGSGRGRPLELWPPTAPSPGAQLSVRKRPGRQGLAAGCSAS